MDQDYQANRSAGIIVYVNWKKKLLGGSISKFL